MARKRYSAEQIIRALELHPWDEEAQSVIDGWSLRADKHLHAARVQQALLFECSLLPHPEA